MGIRFHTLTGAAVSLYTLLFAASCSAIKENRIQCPCALTVEVSGQPAWPLSLSLIGNGFREEVTIPRDTTLVVMVPKSGVQVLALAGAPLPQENAIRIPQGFDCPPLYLYTEWIETPGDSARVKVQLQKHFCTLSLSFEGPPGWGEPYWAEVRGAVDGLSTEGRPLEGPFACRLDGGNSIRLPRQDPEEQLWLDIVMPDRVVRSFALGNYMLDAGYDWTAPDLEDLPLQVKLSVTVLTLHSNHWQKVYPLKVEI